MRKSNVELLRIISMLMIVCLHYLSKGGALVNPADPLYVNGTIAWFVEAFCIVAVNTYVLISGYFATPKSATFQKAIKIWIQVIFYNIIIGLIAIVIGAQTIDLYAIIDLLFPIVTEQYWFATSFILLSFLAPFLQNGAEKIDQRSFGYIILGILAFDSIAKTFLPMQLPWDKKGYDLIWFLCVYLTGMYIKRYGFPKLFQKRSTSVLVYIICQLLTFVSLIAIRMIYARTGKYDYFINYGYSYNFLLCYIGAIGLFSFFLQAKECSAKIAPFINKVAGATFGVYLIHEHKNIRYAWGKWFKCQNAFEMGAAPFILHMLISVLAVFGVCTLLELMRQKLFTLVQKKR